MSFAVVAMAWAGCSSNPSSNQSAKPKSFYLRIGFAQEKKPLIYGELLDNELRLSPTSEGLKTATPIKVVKITHYNAGSSAKPDKQQPMELRDFPPVKLPVTGKGYTEVMAQFSFTYILDDKSGRKYVPYATAHTTAVWFDKSGVKWASLFDIGGPVMEKIDQTEIAEIPEQGRLRLRVEARPNTDEKDLVRFGLEIETRTGDGRSLALDDFQRQGKSAPVRLEIRDDEGKLIRQVKGTVKDSHFT